LQASEGGTARTSILYIWKARGVIMNKEPPPCDGSQSPRFFIGKNSRGNWVVQDERGFRGGLFLDRIQALKFVKSENAGGAPAIVVMKEPFELDMTRVLGLARAEDRAVA
jgi:hypothetical protein